LGRGTGGGEKSSGSEGGARKPKGHERKKKMQDVSTCSDGERGNKLPPKKSTKGKGTDWAAEGKKIRKPSVPKEASEKRGK